MKADTHPERDQETSTPSPVCLTGSDLALGVTEVPIKHVWMPLLFTVEFYRHSAIANMLMFSMYNVYYVYHLSTQHTFYSIKMLIFAN